MTQAVLRARSGLRRDVAALLDALEGEELLVPLARDLPNTPEGERVELPAELKIAPHVLPDGEGQLFAALFTHPEPLEPIVAALEWDTEGQPLKVCGLPARLALELARDLMSDERIAGLVIDPGAESELCLSRTELGNLLAGRAVPLVGYVQHIPGSEIERTLVAEPGDPPPPAFVEALDRVLAELGTAIVGHRLERTFNPDRDLEPHLTLTLTVDESADRPELFRRITKALDGTVPPPGYLDVLFEAP
ncbi:MAG: SseB family protein [Pseudomonadota bacterium]